jgi:predicted transcriptional regulator
VSDHLSDAFRANMRRIMAERGMNPYQLSKLMRAHPTQVQSQIVSRRTVGFTLATLGKYADALGVPVATLLNERTDEPMRKAG